jgi:hypothetical protein
MECRKHHSRVGSQQPMQWCGHGNPRTQRRTPAGGSRPASEGMVGERCKLGMGTRYVEHGAFGM